jgi:DNA-binding response OmpR family regulator
MNPSILIVDDDRFLLENLKSLLEGQGYSVRTAATSGEGLGEIGQKVPDLAILDVNLPDFDGVSLARKIRARWKFPIMMLTAKSGSIDKVVGLEVGADDYLTKPFDGVELVARVRALLRRATEYSSETASGEHRQVGELVIDESVREAFLGGQPLRLTYKEFALLSYLAANGGRVLSRQSLFEHNWGYDMEFGSNSLDVYIYRLRKKIERNPEKPVYLHTVRGYGYKLEHIPHDEH